MAVVAGLWWPRSSWMARRCTPCSSRWVAYECRSVCTDTCFVSPLVRSAARSVFWTSVGPNGPVARRLGKSHGSAGRLRIVAGGGAPVRPQQYEHALGERDIPVLASFAAADPHHQARTINVVRGEVDALGQPQAAGVDRRQAHPHAGIAHEPEHRADLAERENDRERAALGGAHQVEDGPRLVERGLDEEPEPGAADDNGTPRGLAIPDQVQKVLAELVFGEGLERVRRSTAERRHTRDGLEVALLRARRQSAQLHVLAHPIQQRECRHCPSSVKEARQHRSMAFTLGTHPRHERDRP